MAAHLNSSINPLVRLVRGNNESRKWLSAYRIAIVNSAVFFIFSLINAAFDNTPLEAHFIAASLFAVGSVFAFYRLCITGGSLTAVSFYVLGVGIAFGFGTAYSMHEDSYVFRLLFSEADQIKNLPVINLMNSLSVLIVLMTSSFVARVRNSSATKFNLHDIFGMLQTYRLPATFFSGIYLLLYIVNFPIAENLIVRNITGQLKVMPILAIVLSFSMWRQLSIKAKLVAVAISIIIIVCGFLDASKASVLYAILAMIGGLYLGHHRRAAALMLVVTTIFYFAILGTAVSQIRNHWQYDSMKNTLEQRATIVIQLVTGEAPASERIERDSAADQLIRFLHAPYQSYLINEWREGRSGNTLADSWAALVPRILWPDKPIVTRFAFELYGQIFSEGGIGTSSQAPTYTAEALWNYGWPGVMIVSILLGLEIGWFTRKWLQFTRGLSSDLGILVFSVPIAMFAIIVETWIAASYVGGFITLVILVKVADLVMPFLGWKGVERRKAGNPLPRLTA